MWWCECADGWPSCVWCRALLREAVLHPTPRIPMHVAQGKGGFTSAAPGLYRMCRRWPAAMCPTVAAHAVAVPRRRRGAVAAREGIATHTPTSRADPFAPELRTRRTSVAGDGGASSAPGCGWWA